jgi:hypothetical protein
MDNENGLFPVWNLHVGGNGILSFATDKKLQKITKPDLRTFSLKFPFMLTLEPPSVNKGQFPLKIPRPAGQSRSKMAEMQFL